MNKSNQNGVTLISLVVSVIIMLILTSVTVSTSFTAYENAKAEKLKAQLKVIEEAVSNFNADLDVYDAELREEFLGLHKTKTQVEEKLNLMRAKNASGTYTYTASEIDVMNNLEEEINDLDNKLYHQRWFFISNIFRL